MKKFLHYSLLLTAMTVALTACESDDTDMADIIAQYQAEPVAVELDFSELSEAPDVPVTDENDSTFNDYVENTTWDKVININFGGDNVEVNGRVTGVSVQTNGTHVTIMNIAGPVKIVVSGQTSNGSLKFYGDKRFQLELNGASITNPNGAAINNQGGKTMYVVLADGTTNRLQDGKEYTMIEGENQKAALFSEGQMVFSGKGKLEVFAEGRGGIRSDDYIRIRPGVKLYVESRALDGLRANDGIIMDGGVINVVNSGLGAKGVRSGGVMTVNGGRLVAINSGDPRIETTEEGLLDTTACAALSCDTLLVINGGMLKLKATGDGSKGINAKRDIAVHGGNTVAVATGTRELKKSRGLKVDGNFSIDGGYFYSYSRRCDPMDIAGSTTVAPDYKTYELTPRIWTISF
jgi:hypothetical protein